MARGGVDEFGQCVDVGAQQLFQGAVCQNFLYNGVLVLDGFEHLLAGGVLSAP